MAPSPLQPHSANDRLAKLQSFDQSKVGVKGLVDAGIEKIPDIFVLPPDPEVADDQGSSATHPISLQIPVIDLKYVHDEENTNARKQIVQEILEASEKWGFFQVVNHGVSTDTLEEMIDGVRKFHEQPNEEKMKFYSRDISRKVRYNSNFNLYDLKAANWRDTSYFIMAPDAPQPEEFPEVCRDITIKYSAEAREVGITIFELLSEALGLKSNHLTDIGCAEGHYILCHYYPACPQPKLAIGTTPHKDATFITILLQDQIGGLQVLYDHKWVDVPPVPGALIVNIGDFLQLVSNDKFKSALHRVLARDVGPRISVAFFFSTYFSASDRLYGPIKELVSDENPTLYRQIKVVNYVNSYYTRKHDDAAAPTAVIDNFRL